MRQMRTLMVHIRCFSLCSAQLSLDRNLIGDAGAAQFMNVLATNGTLKRVCSAAWNHGRATTLSVPGGDESSVSFESAFSARLQLELEGNQIRDDELRNRAYSWALLPQSGSNDKEPL